jgi:hypothetical protein
MRKNVMMTVMAIALLGSATAVHSQETWNVVGTRAGCMAEMSFPGGRIFFRRMLTGGGWNTFGISSTSFEGLSRGERVGFNFYFGAYRRIDDLPSPEDGLWTRYGIRGNQIMASVPDEFLDKLARFDTFAVDDGNRTIQIVSLRGSSAAVARYRRCWNNLIGLRRY